MTEAQIFQIFGLAWFAIGMGMLINPKFLHSTLEEIAHSTMGALSGGLISLTIGYLIVAFHNIWTGGSSLIITIFGCLAIFKGLALFIVTAQTADMYKRLLDHKGRRDAISWVVVLAGLYFLFLGYFA